MNNYQLVLGFVNQNCERLRLQAVVGQKVGNVIGTLLRFQQDLIVQISGGAIARTLCLGSLLPQNANNRLLCLQIIAEHLSAIESPLEFRGKAAERRQLLKTHHKHAPQTIQTFAQVVDMALHLFIAVLEKLMQWIKFCPLNHKMMLLVLQIQGLETGQEAIHSLTDWGGGGLLQQHNRVTHLAKGLAWQCTGYRSTMLLRGH